MERRCFCCRSLIDYTDTEALERHDQCMLNKILHHCASFRLCGTGYSSHVVYLSHTDYSRQRMMHIVEAIQTYDICDNKRPPFTVDVVESVDRPLSGANYQLTMHWQSTQAYHAM